MNTHTNQKITPFLWFDNQAEEAINFYVSIFPDSEVDLLIRWPEETPFPSDSTKPGGVQQAVFSLAGYQFFGFDAGPLFQFNPSISFFVQCETESEVEGIYGKLVEGGMPLMPLDKYPFSDKYGWIQDRYGVSWQVILAQGPVDQRIFPSLMFVGDNVGRAREAIDLYTSLFQNSRVGEISAYGPDQSPDKEGSINYGEFFLENQKFTAMDSAHKHNFQFNEAISFYVNCGDQVEIDYFWDSFTKEGSESACGWLKDEFGVSWQIVPEFLMDILDDDEPEKAQNMMKVMSQMRKLNLAKLKEAYNTGIK